MNKPLAVMGRVIETGEIEGADRIQQAVVVCGQSGKWSGVVGKDIAVGDAVTVFLQDAVLPPDNRWAFMEKHHWRVRMARFKGVPSECLILRIGHSGEPGLDMTAAMGVTKHEKPIPARMDGEMVGSFPSFIPKTDEPNFQTVDDWQSLLTAGDWYAAEKADGTSCTVWNDEAGMHVCSRNWELREFTASGAGNVYWRAARKLEMNRLPRGLALQFEIVGPGIQSNPMGLADLEVRAFSLYHFGGLYQFGEKGYMPWARLQSICAELGVPVAKVIDCTPRAYTAEELRTLAEIRYQNGKHGEGVVIRANDSSWSFKVINLLYKD